MLVVAAIAALAAAAPASAAIRYAVPDGGPSGESACPDVAANCSLDAAVEEALAGDEVIVTPGTYALVTGTIFVPAGVAVHGEAGQPRPLVTSSGELIFSVDGTASDRSSLRHIAVDGDAATGVAAVNADVTDLIATGSDAATNGVDLGDGATLSSSVVRASGVNAIVVRQGTVILRNVTARAVGPGTAALRVDGSASITHVTVRNTILQGDTFDLQVASEISSSAVVNTDHSSYTAAQVDITGDSSHQPGLGDQTAADPVFSDDAFHQGATSPTIDAGIPDVALPITDIDGDARQLGLAPDIGADEYVPPVIEDPGPGVTPTPTPSGGGTTVAPPAPPTVLIDDIVVTGSGANRTVTVTAHDPDAPMNGVFVDFGNGLTFAESACRTTGGAVFDKGRSVTFEIPVPVASGPAAVVQVLSGGCGAQQSASREISLTPTAAAARSSAAPVAVAAAAPCRGAGTQPRRGGERTAIKAVLCLMNQLRRSARLKPLQWSPKLARAARAHTNDMVKRHFYAHEMPPGAALSARLRRAKWRGRGSGENLGLANLILASPKYMIQAWLNSPPHRANILSRNWKAVGIAMQPKDPLGRLTGAGIYTVDFGTKK
jgi:uncharacterized protein YkwD